VETESLIGLVNEGGDSNAKSSERVEREEGETEVKGVQLERSDEEEREETESLFIG
jgi:hypothetical protein